MPVTISRTDLARNTREIVEQVRQGEPVLVRSYGEDQVVLLDAFDYRLLRALVNYAVGQVAAEAAEVADDELHAIMSAYLDKKISLSKAAEQMSLSRFELMARFERLGIPLRIGPASLDDARDEVRAAQQGTSSRE